MSDVHLRRAAAALLLAGCAASASAPTPASAPEIVWPPPPAAARVRYVQSIAGPADLGLRPSWWQRALGALAGSAAQGMVRPVAVAVAGDRVAVADPGLPAVHLFTSERYQLLAGEEADALVSPVGVAFGPDAGLFVADSALRKVLRFDADGRRAGAIADPDLLRPTGLAWDERTGRLYVADSLAHRVYAYDRSGAKVATFGRRGTAAGELNYPGFLAIDLGGEVLVSDALNFRVEAFAGDTGAFAWSFGQAGDGSGDLARPKGVAVDSHGHIYVADALLDTVQVFDRQGRLLLGFGDRGPGPGQFWMPAGVTIAAADRIYVADSYNRRVQVFQYVGGAD